MKTADNAIVTSVTEWRNRGYVTVHTHPVGAVDSGCKGHSTSPIATDTLTAPVRKKGEHNNLGTEMNKFHTNFVDMDQ